MPTELFFDNLTTFETLVLFLLTVISVLIAISIYMNTETLDEVAEEIIKQEKAPRGVSMTDKSFLGNLISVCILWGSSVLIAGMIFWVILLIDLFLHLVL